MKRRITALRHDRFEPLKPLLQIAEGATLARSRLATTAIDFDVHYLVQVLNGGAKVFGWVSGNEQPELKRHGII